MNIDHLLDDIRKNKFCEDMRETFCEALSQYGIEVDFAVDDIKTIENKVRAIADEIPKVNATAELIDARGNENTLGDRINKIASNIEFKFSNVSPAFHAILNVAKGTVLQNYVIDEATEEIYTSQLIGTIPAGVAETYTISRLNIQGKLIDSMDIRYGGHGTAFGIEKENNITYIWSNYHRTDENGASIGSELVRFPYQPGKEIFFDDESIEVFNKFNDVYTICVTDQKNKRIALRYSDELGQQIVELRNLDDIKNGIDNLLGKVKIPNELSYLQGITIDDYDLYWRVGDTNSVLYDDEIVLFSFKDGREKDRIKCYFGKNTDGVYEDDFREPEGIYLYTNKENGKKSLFASVVTGGVSKRIIKSYAYHQPGNGEKFYGDVLTGIQKHELTRPDGSAKKLPAGLVSLALLTSPGTYYLSTAESNSLIDHPSPGAGYWLEIIPGATNGDVQQILKRNSGVGNYETYIRRVTRMNDITEWEKIDGSNCKTISTELTSLIELRTKGSYYMTQVQSSQFEDHPQPGIAGWFLEVSHLDGSGNHCYQVLRRNTADTKNMLSYYRHVQRNQGELKATEWVLLYGGVTRKLPSDLTLLSDLNDTGNYYITTVETNNLIDHPNPGDAGWFLEVSSINSSSEFYQILRKNVTSNKKNMRVYYRQISSKGISPWRSMLPQEVILYEGNSKGIFDTEITLNDSLNNYDMVYIQVDSDAGKNVTDRTILMSTWASNEVQFQFQNLSNTNGNLDIWFFEYAVMFNETKTAFTNHRCIRLKMSELDNLKTRTDRDKTMGITKIIGINL